MFTVDLKKLKQLRNAHELTLMEMSCALGYVSPNGYHYMEQGIRQIKATQLMQIAKMFGVSIDELFIEN